MVHTELHRHLDVCFRPQTLLQLCQERGIEGQSTSLESFKEKIILRRPLADLNEVLAKFTIVQKVMDRPEVLERLAFEALEDCWLEGTHNVEFRYSPSFVSQYGQLSWEESLTFIQKGLRKGIDRYPEMNVGLICIISRDHGVDNAEQIVDFFLKNLESFVGLDLAGEEDQYPCRIFESPFKRVINKKANITIHAGEGSGPENIWEAIELLGAQRIGHGIASVRDPLLIQYLAKNKICLEMCPTSNWLTFAVPSLAEHPLPRVLRAGVPVSINTDDPGVFGVSLPDEIQICQEKMGMTPLEIEKCMISASNSSFLNKKTFSERN